MPPLARWQRSIPACAGEPPLLCLRAASSRVYPRVCGGTAAAFTGGGSAGGLSPRVRGNRANIHRGRRCGGSIPACAGEPQRRTMMPRHFMVYPRVCGGTCETAIFSWRSPGLSPRVRGNPSICARNCSAERSIPACAGEPLAAQAAGTADVVYPRVCGGTRLASPRSAVILGLSPRVRGNPLEQPGYIIRRGSIPACAGEPTSSPGSSSAPAVYPRVCGGTVAAQSSADLGQGLSPRVRGNPAGRRAWAANGRSIPACAGEPPDTAFPPQRLKVYPRVCGGTNFRSDVSKSPVGLSPRVRGNREIYVRRAAGMGSIPACAGEPNGLASPGT